MGSLLKTLVLLKLWNGLEEEAGRTLPAAHACQSQLRDPTAGQALNYWAALPDVWLIFENLKTSTREQSQLQMKYFAKVAKMNQTVTKHNFL